MEIKSLLRNPIYIFIYFLVELLRDKRQKERKGGR